MARARSQYICRQCRHSSHRWEGRCPGCGEWNSLEERPVPMRHPSAVPASGRPMELTTLVPGGAEPFPTGLAELDRVLCGGLVPGSVTLMAGEPGIGKSTLLLQMLAALAARGRPGLLVSAEETAAQVHRRALRLGPIPQGVWVAPVQDLDGIRAAVSEASPEVVVVDSIQTVMDPEAGAGAGSVTQVRACAEALAAVAKAGGPAVVLVGHVTKDGSIAGPRVLEHLVDTVLAFEGDRHQSLRMLRAVKHRFGAVGELGVWEMAHCGLREVPDAGARLLEDRRPGFPGSAVFPAMDGRRPLLVEIQALVGPETGAAGRRSASGYEAGRLAQLLAVLDRRIGVRLGQHDVYVSVVGGIRVAEPSADLAVALAVVSAATGLAVPPGLVAVGEVGLGGELRQVGHLDARLTEAARHGFDSAVVPRPARPSPTAVGTASAPTTAGQGVTATDGPARPGAAPIRLIPAEDLATALDRHLEAVPAPPRLRILDGAHA